ncbi:MAG: hypothetical protein J6C37_07045 [Roseburia sp.]|nr:hypothetical protein [Roseburia sp.]
METKITEHTGAQLSVNTVVEQNEDGYWYRPAGTVHVNRMLEFEGTKSENNTNTAQEFYAPTYDKDTDTFKVYLGNNGVLSVKATGTLEISKKVTADNGLIAPDKEFTFTVALKDANDTALTGTYRYTVTDAADNAVTDADGNEVIGTIAHGGTLTLKAGQTATIINLPPDANYTVTESTVEGFTASAAGDSVKTEENGNVSVSGKIEAGSVDAAEFVNHHSVEELTFPTEAEGGICGAKILDGRDWQEGDSFRFAITSSNNAPLPENPVVTLIGEKDNLAEDGETVSFDFGKIKFTAPGIYYYTIVEETPGMAEADRLPGVSYTREVYEIIVTVTDQGDGTLRASSVMKKVMDSTGNVISTEITNHTAQFTNTFSAESVKYGPVAIKNYTDNSGINPLTDGMFTFTMTPVTADAPMPEGSTDGVYTASNVGNYVSFGQMTFTQDDVGKTYEYVLSEVLPEEATAENDYTVKGMQYDAAEIKVTVTVELDGDKVKVTPTYKKGEATVTAGEFTNAYTETPVVLGDGTNAPINGTKTLTGRDMLDKEVFEFTLEAADDATASAIANQTIVLEKTSVTVTEGKNGIADAFDFGTAKFTKQGTYTFNVKEIAGKAGGVTYDTHVCTVTVVVTDSDADSVLEASVTYSNGTNAADNSKAVFNNTYKATFDADTAISLTGAKKMTGHPIEDGEYFFKVKLVKDGSEFLVSAAGDSEPDGEGGYEGAITFLNKVTYTQTGTYVYEISEQIPDPQHGGVTYDTSVYRVTVTVTDDYKGTLTAEITKIEWSEDGTEYAEVSVDTEPVFTNTYITEDAVVTPYELVKVLEGNRYNADGTEKPLQAGEYTFEISIVSPDTDNDSHTEEGIILPNAADGYKVANAADGKITFGDITFTKPGTYVLQIKEAIPETAIENEDGTYTLNGITYSANVLQTTFTVTDDGNGKLVALRTGSSGNSQFKNVYEAEGTLPGAKNLEVTKNFTGREWANGESFTFVLVGHDDVTRSAIADGKIVLPSTDDASKAIIEPEITTSIDNAAGITITNNDDVTETLVNGLDAWTKSAAFGDILFKEAGTYTFHIREIGGSMPGVDYDATSRVITVQAVDDGNGNLTVSLVAEKTDDLTFTNRYAPDDVVLYGHGNLHVAKTLTGREWTDTDSFTFTLRSAADDQTGIVENGVSLSTAEAESKGYVLFAENAKEVTVTKDNKDFAHFGNITFTKQGTYKFIVTENAGELASVKYDTSEKEVIVKVTDNGDSTMSVVVDTANSDTLTFFNSYTTEGVLEGATNLQVLKNFMGREWTSEDKFTFILAGHDEVTRTAIATGKIVLPATDDATKEMIKNEIMTGIENVAAITMDTSHITKTTKANTAINSIAAMAFGDITFKEAGTYTFHIIEINGGRPGVNYDATSRIVTVNAVDNGDGTLSVTIVQDKTDALTYENIYEPDDVVLYGYEKLLVAKTLSGREWKEGDSFTFKLSAAADDNTGILVDDIDISTSAAVDAGYVTMSGTELSVTKDNKEFASFGNITFTKPGTYTFIVTERASNIAGITNDPDPTRTVIINVVDNGDGTMSADVDATRSEELTFINTYSPTDATLEGANNLKVKKVLEGRHWFTDGEGKDEFTFTLTPDAATQAAVDAGNVVLPAENTLTLTGSNKEGAFGNIIFKAEGTYTFLINETEGSAEGMEYDGHTETIVVTVTDDKDGELVAAASNNGAELTFKNTYTPDGGTAVIAGTKKMSGRKFLATDTFKFTISAVTEGAPLPANTEVFITGIAGASEQTVSFGSISYTSAGTYEYTITEAAGTIPGVVNDASTWNVTVVVTYNAATGKYVPEVIYEKAGAADTANKAGFVFTNTYTTTASNPSDVDFGATKKVTSLAGSSYSMVGGEFSFKLTPDAGNPAGDPIVAATVTNDNAGAVVFAKDVQYTQAGIYVYTVEEVEGNLAGFTYDKSVYTITVTVTDDEATAKLKASAVITKDGERVTAIEFVNEYKPGGVTLTGKENLKVTKNFTGREDNGWLDADVFTFTLAAAADTQSAVDAGKVVLPANTTLQITKANKDDAYFGDIIFNEVGTYHFLITETKGSIAGVTYDSHTLKVTVTVTDNQKGQLVTAAPIFTGEKTFENTYRTAPVIKTLEGTKTLSGRDLKEGEFTFTITAIGDNAASAPLPAETTVSNTADGKVTFAPITYTAPGVYQYSIKETNGGAAGVSYDGDEVIATVTVTDDTQGQLVAQISYRKGANEVSDSFTFVNGYQPIPVDINLHEILKGAKNVTPTNDGNKYTLEAGTFRFELVPSPDNPTGDPIPAEGVKVSNDASGNIVFAETVRYSAPGTYSYTVDEISDPVTGIIYDSTDYVITVEVTDVNGQLSADVTLKKVVNGAESQADEGVKFNNKYEPLATSVILRGRKELDGKELAANQFEFEVSAVTEGAPMPAVATAKNEATGVITFGTIEYTSVGNSPYIYMIKEKIPAADARAKGYTYDETTYYAVVTITDIGGELRAAVEYRKDAYNGAVVSEPVFKNTYKPLKTSLTGTAALQGTKTLTGRILQPGEFTFLLKNAAGLTVMEAANDAEGKIVFDAANYDGGLDHTDNPLTFTEEGTYWFVIAEKTGDTDNGVAYDETVYDVKVVVTDVDGQLVPAVTCYKAQDEMGVTFTNIYTPDLTTAQISVTKKLTGRDLAADEFEFELKDESGAVIGTAKNNSEGVVTFDELTFSAAGTYKYTVSEKAGTEKYMTYDTTVYEVEIEVTDDLAGHLVARVVKGEGIVFHNTYREPDPTMVQISVTKKLTGRDLAADEFEFELKDAEGTVIDTAKNTANGTVTFKVLTFDKVGTYKYTVNEKAGTAANVTYDTAAYDVEIEVTDEAVTYLTARITKGEGIVITNVYKDPEPATTQISVTKKLSGRDLKAKEFKFELKDESGAVIATAKNTAEGTVTFKELKFTKVGTYKYTVSEIEGTKEYVTYDSAVYEVVIKVTDDRAGHLAAEIVKGGDIVFNNTYKKPESSQNTTSTTTPNPESETKTGEAVIGNVSPKTGDDLSAFGYAALLAIIAIGVIVLAVYGRKKHQ